MSTKAKNRSPRPNFQYGTYAVCGLLLLAIALVFGQTLRFGFIDYDDNSFVYECPQVRAGVTVDGIIWALTDGPEGEWYPLAMMSHMLDCQLFDLKAWGHHLTNVLLHAATSIVLFLFLRKMTGELWPSAFVAVVFAVHPQHVESVAWVAERRDMLAGLFFVLALAAYLGYVRRGRSPAFYLLVAAMLTLSLMAKATAVTLPPLLLLLDFWPLARWGGSADVPRTEQAPDRPGLVWLVAEKLPLLALSAGGCAMTVLTHNQGNNLFPLALRLATAPIACVGYLIQFFYPVDLAVFYPYPDAAIGQPLWQVAGASAIVVAISAAVVIACRRCPYGFVGWFWYLGMLVPVLGLVQVSRHAMADRYMYLPSIGLSIAVTWGLTRLAAGSTEGRWALGGGAALAIAGLIGSAAWQTSFWHDDLTLWQHSLRVTADNSEAEAHLGDALGRKGKLDEAIAHYRRALTFPSVSGAYNNLGSALALQGKPDEAIAQFESALAIDPNSWRAHANLGTARARQSLFADAEQHLRRAIEIAPQMASPHFDLAHVLLAEQRAGEAIIEFERTVAIDPGNPAAHHDLALTLAGQGQLERAIAEFQAALAIDPKSVVARLNLAQVLVNAGRPSEAAAQYRQVLLLDPNNAPARQLLDHLLDAQSGPATP